MKAIDQEVLTKGALVGRFHGEFKSSKDMSYFEMYPIFSKKDSY